MASSGASSDVIGGWQLEISMLGAWNSNLLLEPSADASGRAAASLSGQGARFWQGRTDRIALSVGAGLVRIPQQPELDRESYNFGAVGQHQFSPRADVSATAQARRDVITRALTSNGEGALLAGFVLARSEEVASSASYAVTRKTAGTLSVGAQRVAIDGSRASRGSRGTLGAGITHRRGRFTSFNTNFLYQASQSEGVTTRTPQATVGVQQRLTARLFMSLNAGVAFVTTSQQYSTKTLTGASTVTYGSPLSEFSINAQRSVGQEFGRETPAVQITNSISLSAGRRLLTAWRMSGAVTQVWSQSASDDPMPVRSTIANVAVSYSPRSGPRLEFSGFTARQVAAYTTQPYGVSAGLGYNWSSLRRRGA